MARILASSHSYIAMLLMLLHTRDIKKNSGKCTAVRKL